MTIMTVMPTRLLTLPTRTAVSDAQRKLVDVQEEAATGRRSDIGLALGSRIGSDIELRVRLASLEQFAVDAAQASLGAQTTQQTLSAVSELTDRFRSTLTGARTGEGGRSLTTLVARSSLDTFRDLLSTTQGGNYLFSGLASDAPPIQSYALPRQAVIDAFQAEFGFSPEDPAALDITPDQLQDFLNGTFDDLFEDPSWSDVWSAAAAEGPKFRTTSGQVISLSTTATAPFARDIARALTMAEVFGGSSLNSTSYGIVIDRSLALSSKAQVAIGEEQARVGVGQSQLKEAQTEMEHRRAHIETAVSALEGVDPYESATRMNLLITQLESSYALTARISRLSLLTYL